MEQTIEELVDIQFHLLALEEKGAIREIPQDALADITHIASKVEELKRNLISCTEGYNPWCD